MRTDGAGSSRQRAAHRRKRAGRARPRPAPGPPAFPRGPPRPVLCCLRPDPSLRRMARQCIKLPAVPELRWPRGRAPRTPSPRPPRSWARAALLLPGRLRRQQRTGLEGAPAGRSGVSGGRSEPGPRSRSRRGPQPLLHAPPDGLSGVGGRVTGQWRRRAGRRGCTGSSEAGPACPPADRARRPPSSASAWTRPSRTRTLPSPSSSSSSSPSLPATPLSCLRAAIDEQFLEETKICGGSFQATGCDILRGEGKRLPSGQDTSTLRSGGLKGRRFHFIPLPSGPASGLVGRVILIHQAGHRRH